MFTSVHFFALLVHISVNFVHLSFYTLIITCGSLLHTIFRLNSVQSVHLCVNLCSLLFSFVYFVCHSAKLSTYLCAFVCNMPIVL